MNFLYKKVVPGRSEGAQGEFPLNRFPSRRASSISAMSCFARSTASETLSTRKPFSPFRTGVESCFSEITGIPDAMASKTARL
jgi:hypothetical protein